MNPILELYGLLIWTAAVWVWGWCRGYAAGEGDLRRKVQAEGCCKFTENKSAPSLDE